MSKKKPEYLLPWDLPVSDHTWMQQTSPKCRGHAPLVRQSTDLSVLSNDVFEDDPEDVEVNDTMSSRTVSADKISTIEEATENSTSNSEKAHSRSLAILQRFYLLAFSSWEAELICTDVNSHFLTFEHERRPFFHLFVCQTQTWVN